MTFVVRHIQVCFIGILAKCHKPFLCEKKAEKLLYILRFFVPLHRNGREIVEAKGSRRDAMGRAVERPDAVGECRLWLGSAALPHAE